MDEKLVNEAKSLGIEVSMYYLLPPEKREGTLRKDIIRAKTRSATGDE